MVHDIFQKGLLRGSEKLPFDPEKAYFYVEHPTEKWRVYLRSCCFIHEKPTDASCIDPMRFVVVKRTGGDLTGKEWEPPKGQMEGKDGLRNPKDSIMDILTQNITREVAEESRINNISGLRYTNLFYEGVESDYKPNTFFHYHIFQALVSKRELVAASEELRWCREHPKAFARMKRDKREKDMISWFSPSSSKLMGKTTPKFVALYLKKITGQ
jgi:hypothetical protein